MEYIIGGCSKGSDLIVENAIKYFEERFSKPVEFEGIIENDYFIGIIKEKSSEANRNIYFFEKNKIFKSLYYQEIPELIKNTNEDFDYKNVLRNLHNDFIFINYEKDKGIKVFKDIFAREKIYYSLKAPFLFSTSFKFIISTLDIKKINFNALARYLGFGLNIGEETVISNIRKLDLGEFLHIYQNQIRVNNDWIINNGYFEVSNHNHKDISYWIDNVYNIFKEMLDFPVREPILSMMSGGLDSTVITSIFKKEFDIPIEALTIKVPNYNEEEVEKAIEIAEYLDIPHYVREIRFHDLKELSESYSEIFNILEEPLGGTAYFSRYFAFEEVKKLKKRNIMLGEGAGEVMSYLRHNVIRNFKYTNNLFYVPMSLRTFAMKNLHKLYYPSFRLTKYLKNKNIINSLDIIMNSNLLQSKSQFQTFLSSVQFCNMEDVYRITSQHINFDTYTAANTKKYLEYPYNNYNKYGYHLLNLSPNGDPLISHNLSSLFGLKLYCPYISDVSFKKLLPLPPYIKLTGEGYRTRYKWIVRGIARRKKLLPKKYFEWRPKYGLRQEFFNIDSFESVKSYALQLIDVLKNKSLINMKPFEKFFKKSTLKRITHHSSEYMKFNIWLGLLGWLTNI